jgi:CBS-domain-containing membrane protein
MRHRTVREVMTSSVVTVSLDIGFKSVAAIMAEHGVSALPVLDAGGCVAGIVSETDLLRKEEYSEDAAAGRPPLLGRGRDRAAGLTAEDVMSSPVVTISPDASVVEAARALYRHHVGHLVVAEEDGSLAGIVSPRDLLKVYLRTDEDIRTEILTDIITNYLGTNPAHVEVTVNEGVVTLRGQVENRTMVPLAARLTRAVDGVVAVKADLGYAVNDRRLPMASDLDPQ